MTELTPREIVSELDKFIIGQNSAKKAVAIALRSRWRRKRVDSPLKEEIFPKNILMIGPTGVGKTEISRRLSKLAGAPFLKVEATKFTEVGYVGRDVDQIVRDLIDSSIVMTKERMRKKFIGEKMGSDKGTKRNILNLKKNKKNKTVQKKKKGGGIGKLASILSPAYGIMKGQGPFSSLASGIAKAAGPLAGPLALLAKDKREEAKKRLKKPA